MTAIDFARAFDLEHGDGVAQARRQVHRLGHRGLIHVRESLDCRDQARDAHGGFLNLRRERPNRTSGRRPAEHRARVAGRSRRRQSDRAPRSITAVSASGPAIAGVDAVIRRASRRWRPRVRPAGSGDSTPCGRVREARRAHRVDGDELGIGQLRGAQRSRRLLGVLQTVLEQRTRCVRSRRPGCSARAPVRPTASRARPSSRRAGRST